MWFYVDLVQGCLLVPFIHLYRKAYAQCEFCKEINHLPSPIRFPSTRVIRSEIAEVNEAFLKTLHGSGGQVRVCWNEKYIARCDLLVYAMEKSQEPLLSCSFQIKELSATVVCLIVWHGKCDFQTC